MLTGDCIRPVDENQEVNLPIRHDSPKRIPAHSLLPFRAFVTPLHAASALAEFQETYFIGIQPAEGKGRGIDKAEEARNAHHNCHDLLNNKDLREMQSAFSQTIHAILWWMFIVVTYPFPTLQSSNAVHLGKPESKEAGKGATRGSRRV